MKNSPSYATAIAREARTLLNKAGLRKSRKIFAIGFNKSASFSLHSLFVSYGHPSYHGKAWRSHTDAMTKTYDCFSDGIPDDLEYLDKKFPNSKFILNVRELHGWLYSRLRHIARSPDSLRTEDWDLTVEAVVSWVKERNRYHLFVLDYFKDRPEDLLIVNFISDQEAAAKVAKFLGEKPPASKPHSNSYPGSNEKNAELELIDQCIELLGLTEKDLTSDIYCESLDKSIHPSSTKDL